jgi:predicted nuclease of predicted toxin-antitoxin system
MKFLLDNCVARPVAELLDSLGHEVERIASWTAAPSDQELLEHARSQQQIVITLDKDFGQLAEEQRVPHCGVVRLLAQRPDNQVAICRLLLTNHADELAGNLTAAGMEKIRIRKGTF